MPKLIAEILAVLIDKKLFTTIASELLEQEQQEQF
jgi:hypothetical protein